MAAPDDGRAPPRLPGELAEAIPVAGDGPGLMLYRWRRAPPDAAGLLFGHANGFNAGCYAPFLDRLARQVQVFALDQRGHGASEAPVGADGGVLPALAPDAFGRDLARAAAAVGALLPAGRPLHYVGHSLGGLAALAFAGSGAPTPFRDLVLFEPPVQPPDGHALLATVATFNARLVRATLRRQRDWPDVGAFRAAMAASPVFGRMAPAMLDAYAAAALRPHRAGGFTLCCRPEVEASIFASALTGTVAAAAHRVAIPATLVGGDPAAPDARWIGLYMPELAAALPRGRYRMMAGRGHLMVQEDPDACAGLVLGLLSA